MIKITIENHYIINAFQIRNNINSFDCKFNYNRKEYDNMYEYLLSKLADGSQVKISYNNEELKGVLETLGQVYGDENNYKEISDCRIEKEDYGISLEEVMQKGIDPIEFSKNYAYGEFGIIKVLPEIKDIS